MAVIPDVSNDGGTLRTREIDADTSGGGVGSIKTHRNTSHGRLTGGGIGRFTGGHGHDLHAHDHEAVIEDPHHHDQEDGQDERELDKRLAFAPAPDQAQFVEVGGRFHEPGM